MGLEKLQILYIWGLFESFKHLYGYFIVVVVFMFTISPDDIVATGEDSFYFTNYIKFDVKVELLRGLSLGSVGFYDGTRGHILLTGRSIPNGINTSPDGK